MASTHLTDSYTGEPIDPSKDGYTVVKWMVNGVKMTLTLSDESYFQFQQSVGPWIDVSELTVSPRAAARAQEDYEEKALRDRVQLELEEAQRALEESIQPVIEATADEIPTLSATEAKRMKKTNHGFTLCNEKLLLKIQTIGGPVQIRTNGPSSKIYELQRKVAPLGIQLRLINRFRVHGNLSTEYYGDIYADLIS